MTKFDELYENLFSKVTTPSPGHEITVNLTLDDDRKDNTVTDIVYKPNTSKLTDDEFVKQYYNDKDNTYTHNFTDGTKTQHKIKDIKVVKKSGARFQKDN